MRSVAVLAAGTALSIPPLLACGVTAMLLLHPAYQGDDAGAPAVTVPIGPLHPQAQFRFELPPSPTPYAALDLLLATWETMPVVRWSACAAERCARTLAWAADNQSVRLDLPADLRSGEVEVRLDAVNFGLLAYWGSDATHPRWTASRGSEWPTALSRMSKLATMSGVPRAAWLLAVGAAVLLACGAFAIAMFLRGRSPENEAAEGALPMPEG
ncbi:MAG: hypothetical protein ACJ79H_19810 [Myxococcales bacterium]